jgi:hypothetical protein
MNFPFSRLVPRFAEEALRSAKPSEKILCVTASSPRLREKGNVDNQTTSSKTVLLRRIFTTFPVNPPNPPKSWFTFEKRVLWKPLSI